MMLRRFLSYALFCLILHLRDYYYSCFISHIDFTYPRIVWSNTGGILFSWCNITQQVLTYNFYQLKENIRNGAYWAQTGYKCSIRKCNNKNCQPVNFLIRNFNYKLKLDIPNETICHRASCILSALISLKANS